MSDSTATIADDAPQPSFPMHRITVAQYHRMAETGVLDEDDQVELLEGWLVTKMTKNPRHDATVDRVYRALAARLPANWYVRIQNAVTTSDSEPEPDIAVVRGVPEDYLERHPEPQDIALILEVADTSLQRDREKRRLYARGRIPAYWIVNLVDRKVECWSQPQPQQRPPEFAQQNSVADSDALQIQLTDGTTVPLTAADLLPPPRGT